MFKYTSLLDYDYFECDVLRLSNRPLQQLNFEKVFYQYEFHSCSITSLNMLNQQTCGHNAILFQNSKSMQLTFTCLFSNQREGVTIIFIALLQFVIKNSTSFIQLMQLGFSKYQHHESNSSPEPTSKRKPSSNACLYIIDIHETAFTLDC